MIACNHSMRHMPAMSSITVRNLDDAVKSKLARRARATGDSLESLVRKILTREVGGSTDESWKALVHRLAAEARSLPPSDPESFDFDRLYLRGRGLTRTPPEFDWWPNEKPEGDEPSR